MCSSQPANIQYPEQWAEPQNHYVKVMPSFHFYLEAEAADLVRVLAGTSRSPPVQAVERSDHYLHFAVLWTVTIKPPKSLNDPSVTSLLQTRQTLCNMDTAFWKRE